MMLECSYLKGLSAHHTEYLLVSQRSLTKFHKLMYIPHKQLHVQMIGCKLLGALLLRVVFSKLPQKTPE